jgi:hypothetical protein
MVPAAQDRGDERLPEDGTTRVEDIIGERRRAFVADHMTEAIGNQDPRIRLRAGQARQTPEEKRGA